MPLVITCSAPFHVEIFPRRPDRGAVFSYILEGYLGKCLQASYSNSQKYNSGR